MNVIIISSLIFITLARSNFIIEPRKLLVYRIRFITNMLAAIQLIEVEDSSARI